MGGREREREERGLSTKAETGETRVENEEKVRRRSGEPCGEDVDLFQ